MSSFPELLDVGIMGHCAHGRSGLCVPICYNKDKSGNPLKIKEKRTSKSPSRIENVSGSASSRASHSRSNSSACVSSQHSKLTQPR